MGVLFSDMDLQEVYETRRDEMEQFIFKFSENYMKHRTDDELVKESTRNYLFEPITIDFDNPVSNVEAPNRRNPFASVFYKFSILSGGKELIFVKPDSTPINISIEAEISGNQLIICIPTQSNSVELNSDDKNGVKSLIKKIIESAKPILYVLVNEVHHCNMSLIVFAEHRVSERRAFFIKLRDQNEDLSKF